MVESRRVLIFLLNFILYLFLIVLAGVERLSSTASAMDTSGFSQVGRYGTLSLLKKRTSTVPVNGGPEQSQVVTSFGIDNASLTFGRASTCDVRLYYPSVDPVHCTVVNEDGKAFLAVQGKSGALIDGCWVYPHSSSSNGGSGEQQQQSIIPLSNNSEFEIHGKRFRFTYPPKEVRKVLLATPVAQRNRTLRLSMIQSAQVFSPRPSHDPRENLRILQSPIRTSIFGGATIGGLGETNGPRSRSQSPTKSRAVSPLKFGIRAPSDDEDDEDENNAEDEEQEEEHDENARDRTGYFDEVPQTEEEGHIVLVHTNHPRVVEEERDLVILEDVPLHLVLPSPSVYSGSPVRHGTQRPGLDFAQPQPQAYSQQQPPSTPLPRRSMGGNALHRAVLIRSAQRAVWKVEKEREEEEDREEEMEVLGAVVDPVEGDVDEYDEEEEEEHVLRGRGLRPRQESHGDQQELEDVEMRSVSDEEETGQQEEEMSTEEEDDDEEEKEREQQKPLWRKSIEKIIPWPFGGKKEDDDEYDEDSEKDEDEDSEGAEDENDIPAPLPVRSLQQERLTTNTPARRPLGSFMTPQLQQAKYQSRKNIFPPTTAAPAPVAAPSTEPGHTPAVTAGPGRYSLGGGEARRIIIQQPWKIKDLVVPPIGGASAAAAPALRAMDPPGGLTAASTFTAPTATMAATAVPGSATKPTVTEEERRAIQERRRSAAQELKTREDTFWKDGVPGMMSSPAKSPAKAATGLGVGRPSFMTGGMTPSKKPLFGSPTKGSSLGYSIKESEAEKAAEEEGDELFLDDTARSSKAKVAGTPRKSSASKYQDDNEESLDTNGLLERMRETVESMKQRRRSSAVHRVKGLSGEGESSSSSSSSSEISTPMRALASSQLGSVKKNGTSTFNLSSMSGAVVVVGAAVEAGRTIPGTPVPVTPPKISTAPSSAAPDKSEGDGDGSITEPKDLEPFSLLRPGAARPSLASLQKEQEPEVDKEGDDESDRSVPVPVVVVDAATEETEPEVNTRGAKGRPRLLRVPKTKAQAKEVVDQEDDNTEETQTKPRSASTKPNSRTKPPSSTSTKPRSRSAAKSPAPELVAPKANPTKRQRSRTPQPRPELEEEGGEPEPELAPTRSGGTRKTKKGTAELEEPPVVTPAAISVKKKGRKAANAVPDPVEEEEEVTEEKPAPVKRGRKPRSAAIPASTEEEEPAPAPVKRSRSKKAKELEENEDDDELDSYQVPPDTAPITKAASSSSKKKAEKDKTQTQTRPPSRTQQLKERKAVGSATKVKQEPDVDDSTDPEQKTAATTHTGERGTTLKTPAPRTTTTKAAAAKTATGTGTKPRGRPPKTPASAASGPLAAAAPATSSPADDSEEKENAPGGSGNGSDESKDEPVTKIRVSRRAGAGAVAGSGKSVKSTATRVRSGSKAAVVKTEEEDDGPVATAATTGRARTTRVMRTRTKTG